MKSRWKDRGKQRHASELRSRCTRRRSLLHTALSNHSRPSNWLYPRGDPLQDGPADVLGRIRPSSASFASNKNLSLRLYSANCQQSSTVKVQGRKESHWPRSYLAGASKRGGGVCCPTHLAVRRIYTVLGVSLRLGNLQLKGEKFRGLWALICTACFMCLGSPNS